MGVLVTHCDGYLGDGIAPQCVGDGTPMGVFTMVLRWVCSPMVLRSCDW